MNSKILQPGDLELFTSISQISLNPSGKLVAVTVTKPSLSANEYKSWIEVFDITSGKRVYVSEGPRNFLPRWSPDGRLFYLRVVDSNKFSIIEHIIGNGSRETVTFDKPIKDYGVCRDDIAYVVVQDLKEKPDPDVIYTTDIPIWHDGTGFVHNISLRLYRVNLRSEYTEPLTSTDYNVTHLALSRNCETGIVAVAENKQNPVMSKLYMFKPPSHELVPLLNGKEYYIEGIDVDEYIVAVAAHAMERGYATHVKLLVIDLNKNSIIHYEAPLGKRVGGRVYIDVSTHPFSTSRPRIHGNKIYFVLSDGGKNPLYVWDGLIYRELLSGNFVILDFDVGDNCVVFTKSDDISPIELYVYSFEDGSTKKITNYNDWISEYRLSKPRHFTFVTSDGVLVDGWIMEPIEKILEVDGKSPAILEIHGGPKSKYGFAFMFEFQLLASRGFYVIYFNPRGSDGYSEDFADIRFRYGERDFRDIMEGLDYVLRMEDKIDPDRLGVIGLSYGGFMTNWIIVHTDRFKAAISEAGISSWTTMYGVSDIGFIFVPAEIGDPFSSIELLEKKSPINYVQNVKTPVLFLHGLTDYRCYIEQALIMHTALRHLGRSSAIALFKDCAHGFGMSGKPRPRVKRYQVILEWFEKYLKVSK